MSNIEKIRQEIERLKKWSESSKKEWIDEGYNQNAFAEDCRIKSFDKLLSFIDSLPEEKLSEDLEEAAVRWEPKYGIQVSELIIRDIRDAFISGGELQKGQMMKEAVEVDVADLNGEIYNNCIEKGMTDEDKVKIIIVKE